MTTPLSGRDKGKNLPAENEAKQRVVDAPTSTTPPRPLNGESVTTDPLAGVSPQTELGERTSATPAEDAREQQRDPLLMVTGPRLLLVADEMKRRGVATERLRNGVDVTLAQLRKAGEILRDGPQPFCNGIKDDMPGFIDRDAQKGKSLVLQVGILPSRTYRIDALGRARTT